MQEKKIAVLLLAGLVSSLVSYPTQLLESAAMRPALALKELVKEEHWRLIGVRFILRESWLQGPVFLKTQTFHAY